MAFESIGSFQVLGTLGTGAHSTILHIRRSADAAQYALKIVPIDGKGEIKFLRQAEHEFRIAKKLDHQNLIKIYALEKQRAWTLRVREVRLLIEYVNGRTLDKFKIMAIPKLVQVFAQVAAGLAHMHRRDVCHGDMKPNNVIISRTGDVKIIDYGLAWLKGEAKNRVQGTPEYMAPEQAKEKIVNERTDIFNFGALMYRMTTWRHIPAVISGGDIATLPLTAFAWQALLKPVREFNSDAPPALADLIQKCVAYNPNSRPATMAGMRDVLEKLARELIRTPDDRLEALEWQT